MNSEKALEVTASELEAFCNEAFRNIDMPPLDRADMADVKDALYAFLKRQPLAKPSPAPVEREGTFAEWSTDSLAGQCRMQAREQLDPEFSQFMEAVAARLAALAPEPVREGQRVGTDELTDAKQLLDMLVAADDEARPNGIMDCIDNNGHPYQSAFMAGLITHARMLVRPYDHAAAIAAFRASEPLSAREGE